jgi:hypothetical protein
MRIVLQLDAADGTGTARPQYRLITGLDHYGVVVPSSASEGHVPRHGNEEACPGSNGYNTPLPEAYRSVTCEVRTT